MKLTDSEIIADILSQEKNLAKMYMDSILESNCTKMRSTLGKVHMEIADNQYKCFEYMNSNNLYPVKNADVKDLKQTIQKYSQPLA